MNKYSYSSNASETEDKLLSKGHLPWCRLKTFFKDSQQQNAKVVNTYL